MAKYTETLIDYIEAGGTLPAPFEDITGVLLLPTLFAYPILRCLWDWIFVICSVISVTAKYIFEKVICYVSTFKRYIRNGGVNCN